MTNVKFNLLRTVLVLFLIQVIIILVVATGLQSSRVKSLGEGDNRVHRDVEVTKGFNESSDFDDFPFEDLKEEC